MSLRHILPIAVLAFVGAVFAFPVQHSDQAKEPGQVASNKNIGSTEVFDTWKAGSTVSEQAVKAYGEERCFAVDTISDATFRRMYGKSYKRGCTLSRSDLRYVRVLHRTVDDRIVLGEIVCHKSISKDLADIFRTLYAARYPIERMVLIDNYDADDERSMTANNTSCFNYRNIGRSSQLSNHSLGKAIDINPLYNPCVRRLRNGTTRITPVAGKRYADRSQQFSYKIDKTDLCYREFIRHGFRWGGSWRSVKDYQHFEKP